jgi:anaerobic selenocysteine-containing dehydrogenase
MDVKDLRAGGAVKLAPEPGHQRFATPSGKLEFYSETLAAQGLPAMPDWVSDPDERAASERFPLRLLTAPGYFQAHTAWAGVATLRRRAGEPECVLHPEDAAARGLRDGQAVKLESRHGTVRLRLRVSDETSRGVAFVPGQRPAAGESGTVNMLCSDRYSDLGEGATYQSTRLQVSAIPDGEASA